MISKKQHKKILKAQINEGGGYPIPQAATSPKQMLQWQSWDNMALYQELKAIKDLLSELVKLQQR